MFFQIPVTAAISVTDYVVKLNNYSSSLLKSNGMMGERKKSHFVIALWAFGDCSGDDVPLLPMSSKS